MDAASPFAGILIGQPTLSRQLRMGVFAALDQRIVTRFAIQAMDIGESAAYLWSVPAFLDGGLGCQLVEVSVA